MKTKQTAIDGTTKLVAVALVAWLGLVLFLAGNGKLLGTPGAPPIAIMLSAVLPIAVFLLAFWSSHAFRRFVLSFDPRLNAGIQAWRFAGFGFLALFAYRVLPGAFAWPAGLGDMAVGITAPWIALGLINRPDFASSRSYTIWNLFGIADLVVALSMGGVTSMLAQNAETTMSPMAQLPLALIPAYLVPIFLMLHLSALFQSRQNRANGQSATARPQMLPQHGSI